MRRVLASAGARRRHDRLVHAPPSSLRSVDCVASRRVPGRRRAAHLAHRDLGGRARRRSVGIGDARDRHAARRVASRRASADHAHRSARCPSASGGRARPPDRRPAAASPHRDRGAVGQPARPCGGRGGGDGRRGAAWRCSTTWCSSVVPRTWRSAWCWPRWRCPGKPGFAALAAVLDERSEASVPGDSELERALFAALLGAGLPRPEAQRTLPGTGAVTGVVDAAYPDCRLILEADGRRSLARVTDLRRDP